MAATKVTFTNKNAGDTVSSSDINQLKNSANGAIDDAASALSVANIAQTTANNAVVKISGKGLSSNDFTDQYKVKVDSLTNYFVGAFSSLSALQIAFPTGVAGQYANVDIQGANAVQYIWDNTDNAWVQGSSSSGSGGSSVISVNGQSGAVILDKTSVGLSNVPNVDATQRANQTGIQSADTITDGSTNKVYSAVDKTKLAGIATSATANSPDSTLLARSNHTGTQSADTVVDGTVNKAYTAADKATVTNIPIALAGKVNTNGTDRLITQAEALQLAGTPAAIAAASTIIPSPLYVPPKNSKNLFNQYLRRNGYGIGTGTGTPTISGFTNGALTNKIYIQPNTTFTLSGLTAATGRRLSYFDSTGTIIGTTVSITGTTHTLTTTAGTSYLLFTARINGESMDTIQLELGATATSYDTAEDPITIIMDGTSITNNYISGGTAYITLIKNALEPVYGKKFNLINGGVTNQTSAGMLTNLPALLSANPTAKVVMLETSINDAKLDSAGGLTPAETEANLRAMIALIKAAGMQPILKTCLPINPLGTSTAYPTSGSSTMDQTKRSSLNIITRRLSKELNLILSDWDFGFAQRTDAEMLVDFLHPASPLGTQKVADIDIKALISPTY